MYKIGIATNVQKRMKQLQTGCPYPIELFAAVKCIDPRTIEKDLHLMLDFYRQQGEWFCCAFDVIRKAVRFMEDAAYIQMPHKSKIKQELEDRLNAIRNIV